MYIVKHFFTDLQDKGHAYNPGDIYPREGLKPSQDRITELKSDTNRQGKALIMEVEVKKTTPKKPAAKKAVKKPADK